MSKDEAHDFDDRDSVHSESTFEVYSNPYSLLEEQLDCLSSKVSDYENKLKKEHN